MKTILIFFSLIFSIPVFADESKKFCEFLLARSEIDAKSYLVSTDTRSKIQELLKMSALEGDFQRLAKHGVEKKMSWDSFKKFSADQKVVLSNYFQPKYDELYKSQYCGSIQAGIDPTSSTIRRGKVEAFEKRPKPSEHPDYLRQMSSR